MQFNEATTGISVQRCFRVAARECLRRFARPDFALTVNLTQLDGADRRANQPD
jgi:hypothetical protein